MSQTWHRYLGGQFWPGWYWYGPASTTFFLDVLGLDIGRDLELKARAYAATVESACWWWPHRRFIVVSERPAVLEKHANGQLMVARWEWTDEEGKVQSWEVRR